MICYDTCRLERCWALRPVRLQINCHVSGNEIDDHSYSKQLAVKISLLQSSEFCNWSNEGVLQIANKDSGILELKTVQDCQTIWAVELTKFEIQYLLCAQCINYCRL
jgi:hypothetical protein